MTYVALHRPSLAKWLLVVAVIGLSSSVRAELLHSGLISYWPLSEGSGTTAGDVGPAGFVADNGQLRNDPTWINGQFGAGLQFSGTQDVLIPASTDMDINASAVTLSAWVKFDQLPSELTGSFSGIYDSGPDNYVIYLDKGSNELRFKSTVEGGAFERPGVFAKHLDTTSWHHVMGVYDGSKGSMEIYFDGELADRASAFGLLHGVVRAGQVASIGGQAGAEPPHELANPFHGGIADVAVWNRPLGLAEAQYLYNNGTGNAVGAANPNITPVSVTPTQPIAQPVVYYNFDGNLDNHGTGGSAFNATLHDVPGRNDNLYTTSQFGQGLDLRENPEAAFSDDEGGDFLSVNYTLPDSGTIAMRVQIEAPLYNYNSLWSNSSHENDWEAWIYGDGRIAARLDRSSGFLSYNVFLMDDQLGEHHYAYSWERDGDSVESRLYIDGVLQGTTIAAWRDPGDTVFIGGGLGPPNANHLARALFDEVRIYDTALSEAEILYLSQNAPETMFFSGDYNGDGVVDARDYVVWRNTLGNNVAPGTGADGSGNGIVGVEDYNIWKTDYKNGMPAALAASQVPEPSTVAMLLASLGTVAWCRRRCPSLFPKSR